jgi:uncharacterized protein
MGHPNADVVSSAYQAFDTGDLEGVANFIAENCVWHITNSGPLTGDYKGRDAILGFLGRLMEETGGTFKTRPHAVVADDDHAVVLLDVSASRNGKTMSDKQAATYHVQNGQSTEAWFLYEDGSQLADFWA